PGSSASSPPVSPAATCSRTSRARWHAPALRTSTAPWNCSSRSATSAAAPRRRARAAGPPPARESTPTRGHKPDPNPRSPNPPNPAPFGDSGIWGWGPLRKETHVSNERELIRSAREVFGPATAAGATVRALCAALEKRLDGRSRPATDEQALRAEVDDNLTTTMLVWADAIEDEGKVRLAEGMRWLARQGKRPGAVGG